MEYNVKKDSKIVDIVVAQAMNKSVDSDIAEKANKAIQEQAADPNPHNRYQIAQLIGFAVTEINKPKSNWLESLADVKRVGFGEKAEFKVRQEGIKAFIQAKGATTARSKVANKTMTLDTVSVSARPMINLVELRTGQAQMSDLILDASYQMELAQIGYIQKVLDDAAKTWESPYYASGSGIVKATLDPMINFWRRQAGGAAPTILGDINMLSKLAELTGFKSGLGGGNQYSNDIINEQNNMGYIGTYNGCKVANLVNPYMTGAKEPIFPTDKLYILPGGVDASTRPLKVVYEGDTSSMEATYIDDMSYEVRLDQDFGAGIVFGTQQYLSVYDDSSV